MFGVCDAVAGKPIIPFNNLKQSLLHTEVAVMAMKRVAATAVALKKHAQRMRPTVSRSSESRHAAVEVLPSV
jgi:hypothetical protein